MTVAASSDKAERPTKRSVVAAIVFGTLPVWLWFVLNFMRPDLLAPMLDHVFGYIITVAEALLTLLALLAYLVVVAAKRQSRGRRIGLSIAAALLCTVPALLLVLFGPIVFAFMHGNQDG